MLDEVFELLDVLWTEVADISERRFAMVVPTDMMIDGSRVSGDFVDVWYGPGNGMQGCWSCSDAHREGKQRK